MCEMSNYFFIFFHFFSSVLLPMFSLSAVFGLVPMRAGFSEQDFKPYLWSFYLNFHMYNIAQKAQKVKKNLQLFSCTILLSKQLFFCKILLPEVLLSQAFTKKRRGKFFASQVFFKFFKVFCGEPSPAVYGS